MNPINYPAQSNTNSSLGKQREMGETFVQDQDVRINLIVKWRQHHVQQLH